MITKVKEYFDYIREGNAIDIEDLRNIFPHFETLNVEHDNLYHYENIDRHSATVANLLETKTNLSLLTAIYHDIGKPVCKKRIEEKDKTTYYGHDLVGAEMAYNILQEIASPKTIESVVKIIGQHQSLYSSTNRIGVYKHLKRLGIVEDTLNVLKADIMAHTNPNLEKFNNILLDFETFHKENVVFNYESYNNFPNLINNIKNDKVAIMLIGSTRSGKTTVRNEILGMLKSSILSADDIRMNDFCVKFDAKIEPQVWKIHEKYLSTYIKNNENIIIDNTSTIIKSRKAIISRLKKNGYKIIGIFVEADLKTLCDRALEYNMPISVPIRMFSQLELPDLREGFDYIYEKSNCYENFVD
jgi:putative nucleotidyltransferase with HDIG domain